ncbi:response regulator transcription factor [Salipaludibacillus neizhouensis]|uniref:response regulator transcription factor n=1 Tax=Salipaludibacillus neizhouensis TaxID=885475 RepID=UPI00217DD7B4|nr:response regulator [Salipaludibacillus neizhouensis]
MRKWSDNVYSILLVEDEKWVRTVIRKVIEKTNLSFQVVKEVAHGMEALDWLNDHSVDIILTDIRMPVMDGLALTNQIRDKEISTDVIVISGYDDFEYAQQALRMGVFDYLLKPLEEEDMKNCLKKWLADNETNHEVEERTETEINEELSTTEQVIRLIEDSMPGGVSLKEAAGKVYLNSCYLSQLFKEETGKNFNEYVTSLRMKEAATFLTRTSLRISEVAERLGYSDIAYFTNSFKKFYKTTPSNYRRQHKKV